MTKSKILPKLTEQEITEEVKSINFFGYGRFKKIFAPNEVFQSQIANKTFKKIEKPSSSISEDIVSSCKKK